MKKQEFAIRILFSLLPWYVSRNLPSGLLQAMFGDSLAPPEGWPPYSPFPPGWTPGDPLPPGVDVPPGVTFPPGWTPGDPLPPGVDVPPGVTFPPGWTPGDPLPPGFLPPDQLPSDPFGIPDYLRPGPGLSGPIYPPGLSPGGPGPPKPPPQPAPEPSLYTIFSNITDAWLRNVNKATWPLARDSASSGAIGTTTTSYTFATQAERITALFYCARSFFDFDLSSIPSSASIISAALSLTTTGPYLHTLCVQEGTQSIPMSTADFQAFTGPLFATETTLIGLNTITLNATALAYLQSVFGSIAKLSVREYDYDYLNVAPTATFGRVGLYFADTPDDADKPTLTIVTS